MNIKKKINQFKELFADILFLGYDIELGYCEKYNSIIVLIGKTIHGFIEFDYLDQGWSLHTKNHDFVNSIYASFDIRDYKKILFNFLKTCIQRIEIEKAINGEYTKEKG